MAQIMIKEAAKALIDKMPDNAEEHLDSIYRYIARHSETYANVWSML